MTPIRFTVPGVPTPTPRPRATTIHGKARNYTPLTVGKGSERRPHPAVEFKATTRIVASEAYTGPPLTGPLRVDVVFVFPRTSTQIWKKRPMPRLLHAKKPDRDNLDKTLLDALKGLLFVDDCQVCAGEIQKWIAAGDEAAHTEIEVQALSLPA